MKADNWYYGQNRVLARHAGLSGDPPRIWGYLQHGWHPGRGFPDRYELVPRLPKLVWSHRNRRAALRAGMQRVVPIGAAFLYLEQVQSAEPAVQPSGTLVYPFHSAPGEEAVGSHDAYLRMILEREAGPVTVCLYYLDAEQAGVRRMYEEAGVRVICHGHRLDPAFLERQMDALRSHERVVTNRASTALFYAAAIGRSVEVYGPTFGVNDVAEGVTFDAFQRAEWPELFDGGVTGSSAREIGQEELGAAFIRSPEELRSMLGWTAPRRFVGAAAGPALALRAAAKRRNRSSEGPLETGDQYGPSRHDPARVVGLVRDRDAPGGDDWSDGSPGVLLEVPSLHVLALLTSVRAAWTSPGRAVRALRRAVRAAPRGGVRHAVAGGLWMLGAHRRVVPLDWIHATASPRSVGAAAVLASMRDQAFSTDPADREAPGPDSGCAFQPSAPVTDAARLELLIDEMTSTGW